MWVMQGTFGDERMMKELWHGRGWTQDMNEALKYDDPDEAQEVADSLHLASCNFDHAKARATVFQSNFVVLDEDTGEAHIPQPLVAARFIFARRKVERVSA